VNSLGAARRLDVDPIAITGLGIVSPLGTCMADALAAARRGQSGIRRFESAWADAAHPAFHARIGGTIDSFDATSLLEPQLAARHEPGVLWALAAADEALRQSGATIERKSARVGSVIGAGLPGAELWHRALHAAFFDHRPHDIARMTAAAITGNAATGLLALRHAIRGPALGIANACASGATAIAIAADQIRLGRADMMLAGGCESSLRGVLVEGSFATAGMNPTRDPERACAPFDRTRRGFVLAEGAAMLVLERLDHARARGARILAVLAGASITNDAHHVISPDPTGGVWADTIQRALDEAGVAPEEVDTVSAHATGTPQGDVAETRAIRRAFGAHADRLAVSATKSMHGHPFGAAGAVELVLAIAAMREDVVLPTINLHDPDPECDLDYVPNVARAHTTRVLLKNSFGAGGAATCLVVRRGE
jgi:3-oxoacyl-[acyl-carrier-protein] synthase II